MLNIFTTKYGRCTKVCKVSLGGGKDHYVNVDLLLTSVSLNPKRTRGIANFLGVLW